MTVAEIVIILGAVFGSGGVVAGWNAWQSHRAGVRTADVQEEANALSGFRDLTKDLREEVPRLRADREEDRVRIDRIEAEIKVERDAKCSAIQYIRQLHSWIVSHMPASAGPVPPVPDDLTQHIHPPRKDPS